MCEVYDLTKAVGVAKDCAGLWTLISGELVDLERRSTLHAFCGKFALSNRIIPIITSKAERVPIALEFQSKTFAS